MTTLRTAISQLANQFASGVLEAIRGASLAEILAESERGGGGTTGARRGRPPASPGAHGASSAGSAPAKKRRRGRLERRSATDIAGVVRQVVELLGLHPEGLRAEQIRHELGLEAKELPRPIAEALASRKIAKRGQKRATTYFAKGAKGSAKVGDAKTAKRAAKAGKTAGKKRGKRASAKKRGAKRAAGAAASQTNGASASA